MIASRQLIRLESDVRTSRLPETKKEYRPSTQNNRQIGLSVVQYT